MYSILGSSGLLACSQERPVWGLSLPLGLLWPSRGSGDQHLSLLITHTLGTAVGTVQEVGRVSLLGWCLVVLRASQLMDREHLLAGCCLS